MHIRPPRLSAVLLVGAIVASGGGAAQETPDDPLESLRADLARGQVVEVQAAARALLAEVEQADGADSLAAAEVLDVLVESLWRGGKAEAPETRELARRAVAIKERTLGEDHGSLGKSLHNQAVVHYFLAEYDAARPLWERAATVREQALGPDHPDVAESINGLANLLQVIGDYETARTLYERAVEIRETAYGPDHPRVAQTLNNLAVMLTSIGDYVAALPLAERSLRIKEQAFGPDHPQVAITLSNLADLSDAMGDHDRAVGQFERAAKIFEGAFGPQHPYVGSALSNLALHYQLVEDYDAALVTYERALPILEGALGPEHPDVATCLNNLGTLLQLTGEYERARGLLLRAVEIREAALGADHPDVAEGLDNLGILLTATGEYDAARPRLERATAIRVESLGATHPDVATTRTHVALLDARTGRSAEALEAALEAERISREHLRLTGRAFAEEQALRYAAVRTSGLDLALSLAGRAPDASFTGPILDELIRSRAVVLDAMAARHSVASRSSDPEIARLAAELAAARVRLANLSVKGLGGLTPEHYRGLLDEARQDRENAERALASASTSFALEQERSRLGLSEVATNLPDNAALVSFVQYGDVDVAPAKEGPAGQETVAPPRDPIASYAAIVLRGDRPEPSIVALGTADELDGLIERWKREASRGASNIRRTPAESEQAYREVAGALGSAVWQPLATRLTDLERVFVVPDGELNLVSLASLPVGTDSYLIESGPLLHYLSAERDLVPAGGNHGVGKGLFAVGGPDYDDKALFAALGPEPDADVAETTDEPASDGTRSGCGNLGSLRFEPLPAAESEAHEVAALWREEESGSESGVSVVELSGSAASEATFKNGAPGRRVLHLATHGFFLGSDCAAGAGSRGLTVAADADPEPSAAFGLSPLLLSGLALAGANHRASASPGEEDGILTAEEIAGLDLSGTEWAVLSACDTGVGEIRAGEGVFGLRRAMQLAGVRTLIMSLWPVSDEATQSWMVALYDARLRGKLDSAESVRSAGLSLLRERREAAESTHPFYWAAFVGAGDWR